MRLLFVWAMLAAGLWGAVTIGASSYDYYRLPTALVPEKYTLQILTHLEEPAKFMYEGRVAIRFHVLEDTNNITLHSQNLTIDAKNIRLKTYRDNTTTVCGESVEVNADHDYYIIKMCRPLLKGETYKVKLRFSGVLNEKLHGYYRSSYFDKASNQTRWLSVTQFEPAFARAAFPCFDEPALKAKFLISLGHHKSLTALSNMPLRMQVPMSDLTDFVWSIFEESVPMSTYLVAYVISDFASLRSAATPETDNNVQFHTWARPEAIDQCQYASVVGPKILKYFEDIFGIPFPLKKVDQIAVPDFSAGAMENWGLVTYRETALLYAENVSSLSNKQVTTSIIAHELAHQWFGNLVTMKWWTDLWLNEGFATYIATLGVNYLNPEWKTLDTESVENTLAIFQLDALKSSHPISQPIKHTNEIAERFDSISYKKGSTVLRMLHLILGEESFFGGIQDYLERHAYKNAEQDDLWAAFTSRAHKYNRIETGFDMKTIMDSWTLQTGYPLVRVDRNYAAKTAEVSQQRYLVDSSASRSASKSCWWVPLSYTTETSSRDPSPAPLSWLDCDESTQSVNRTLENVASPEEWLLFNVHLSGVYRVMYDAYNWELLTRTMLSDKFTDIHIINRAQLVDDALWLAWSGDLDYEIALRLIEYLKQEREYLAWKAGLDSLSYLNRLLRQTPIYKFFKEYVRKLLKPIYVHLEGLNNTLSPNEASHTAVLHKALIARWACRFEVDDCVPRARDYFLKWRSVKDPDTENHIPVDLRPAVYCAAIRHGNDDDWQFLWTRYKNSNVATEQRTIISALGCSRNATTLRTYIGWAYDKDELIRKQDASFAFGSVARNEVGFTLANEYFMENIEMLHKFYGPHSSELGRLLTPLASQIASQQSLDAFSAFVAKKKDIFKETEQTVRRSLEIITINVQWMERNLQGLQHHLHRRLPLL